MTVIADRYFFSLRAVGNLVTEEPSIYQMIAANKCWFWYSWFKVMRWPTTQVESAIYSRRQGHLKLDWTFRFTNMPETLWWTFLVLNYIKKTNKGFHAGTKLYNHRYWSRRRGSWRKNARNIWEDLSNEAVWAKSTYTSHKFASVEVANDIPPKSN